MKTLLATLLLLVSMGAMAQGQATQSKPNYSGMWVFNAQKSSLKMAAPASLTLQVQQTDPQIQMVRTQSYGEQSDTWKLDIVADGQKEVVQTSPLYTATIRMYWEGNSLVLDQKITAGDGTKATDIVTYSLVDGGNTLEAVENQKTEGMKKPLMNKWVYEKKVQ